MLETALFSASRLLVTVKSQTWLPDLPPFSCAHKNAVVQTPCGALSNADLASYFEFVQYLLHIRYAGRNLLGLLALIRSLYTPFQGQHAILGVVANVLLVQSLRNQYRLIVLLNRGIQVRRDSPGFRLLAYGSNSDFIGDDAVPSSRRAHAAAELLDDAVVRDCLADHWWGRN